MGSRGCSIYSNNRAPNRNCQKKTTKIEKLLLMYTAFNRPSLKNHQLLERSDATLPTLITQMPLAFLKDKTHSCSNKMKIKMPRQSRIWITSWKLTCKAIGAGRSIWGGTRSKRQSLPFNLIRRSRTANRKSSQTSLAPTCPPCPSTTSKQSSRIWWRGVCDRLQKKTVSNSKVVMKLCTQGKSRSV